MECQMLFYINKKIEIYTYLQPPSSSHRRDQIPESLFSILLRVDPRVESDRVRFSVAAALAASAKSPTCHPADPLSPLPSREKSLMPLLFCAADHILAKRPETVALPERVLYAPDAADEGRGIEGDGGRDTLRLSVGVFVPEWGPLSLFGEFPPITSIVGPMLWYRGMASSFGKVPCSCIVLRRNSCPGISRSMSSSPAFSAGVL